MEKTLDLGETIDLGSATVETLGGAIGSGELVNPKALPSLAISDDD